MKIDIFNSDWEELENLPPIEKKPKKKSNKDDENPSKKDTYKKRGKDDINVLLR